MTVAELSTETERHLYVESLFRFSDCGLMSDFAACDDLLSRITQTTTVRWSVMAMADFRRCFEGMFRAYRSAAVDKGTAVETIVALLEAAVCGNKAVLQRMGITFSPAT